MVRCFKAFIRTRPCCCYLLLLICMFVLLVNYFEIASSFDCAQRLRELKGALSSASVQQHLQALQSRSDCCPSSRKISSQRFSTRRKTSFLNENEASRNYLTLPHLSLVFPHYNSSFGTKDGHVDRVYFKYLQTRFKRNSSFVIGIPTVKRPNETIYLYDMLNSLFRAIEDKDRSSVLVVLFIAEVSCTSSNNQTYRQNPFFEPFAKPNSSKTKLSSIQRSNEYRSCMRRNLNKECWI